ncbi:MAG: hypothetical protein V7K55_01545 [Nostoc sp.]
MPYHLPTARAANVKARFDRLFGIALRSRPQKALRTHKTNGKMPLIR